ncbi:hypothetical protein [Cytobacillus sp. NCCP-133]|uniref:hypothetical protein n=1 Tax=Cytobacillus sp. NCCP-133 TaxID=766848 RepID=UPI0022312603|nr:hypothetical protein [Cytobacillus sp. NCCP-133]GLB62103.1 hypothetical protein NCCP133_42320 [Cytobacillus sp. NCCP-133]
MNKKIFIGFLLILLFIIVSGASYFFKGNHISEEMYYKGRSENWEVTTKILEQGKNNYENTTIIEYIGNGEIPKEISWKLEGNRFGTGGSNILNDGKLTKIEQLRDIEITLKEQYFITVEWNNNYKEDIIIYLEDH